MKELLRLPRLSFAWVLALSGIAWAAPLPRERIAADAKWILHADLTGFRGSQLGGYVQTNYLDQFLKQMSSNMKFDAQALVQKMTSITAYGSGFKKQDPEASLSTGVLLLQADAETQKILEGALAAQLLANTNGPLRKLQGEPYPLYAVGSDLYGAIQSNGMILVGKSRERIDQASLVLAGKSPSLKESKMFTDFPVSSDSYFFLGIAAEFNELADIPPQARVLQMADGVRLTLGEKAELLQAELALKSKSTEVVNQIQQVLQGVVALFSLGQPENQDIAELVRNTKVTTLDQFVAVGVKYPVAKALALIEQLNAPEPPAPKKPAKATKKKNKAVEKAESKPEEPNGEKTEAK